MFKNNCFCSSCLLLLIFLLRGLILLLIQQAFSKGPLQRFLHRVISGRLLSYLKARRISRNSHSLSLVVPLVVIRCTTRCHSLSLVVTRCTTHCHSLSLVAIHCTTRCHSLFHLLSFVVTCCHLLSLVVPLVVTRCYSMYQQYVFL